MRSYLVCVRVCTLFKCSNLSSHFRFGLDSGIQSHSAPPATALMAFGPNNPSSKNTFSFAYYGALSFLAFFDRPCLLQSVLMRTIGARVGRTRDWIFVSFGLRDIVPWILVALSSNQMRLLRKNETDWSISRENQHNSEFGANDGFRLCIYWTRFFKNESPDQH